MSKAMYPKGAVEGDPVDTPHSRAPLPDHRLFLRSRGPKLRLCSFIGGIVEFTGKKIDVGPSAPPIMLTDAATLSFIFLPYIKCHHGSP